jgi:hypothetical protein
MSLSFPENISYFGAFLAKLLKFLCGEVPKIRPFEYIAASVQNSLMSIFAKKMFFSFFAMLWRCLQLGIFT